VRVLSRKLVGSRSVVLAMALSSVLAMVGCASSNSSSTGSNITATPTFSPGAGTYTTAQTVTIADTTQGAVLYCTTDGTTPTTSSPQCSQPTTVFKTEFLQAIAVAPSMTASAVASAGYTISPNAAASPTFNPAGGTYAGTQTVTISDGTPGANVYYTLDGTSPSANSTLYTGPLSISQSTTLSAVAVISGFANSPIVTAAYTIQAGLPTPTVGSVSPNFASAGGATFVMTVNGSNFVSGSTVLWNGTALTTTYVSAAQLTASVPASLIVSAGTANVTVAQASVVSGAAIFTINGVTPTIAALSPSSGSAGTSVAITGTNFTGATAVSFGTTPATSFQVISATSITAVSPVGTGTVDVKVTTPNGTSATAAADQFTYTSSVPTLTGISPAGGSTAGGTSVTVTGTNFTGATAVNFGTTPATSFQVISATSITAVSPAGTGTVDVMVTTPNGASAIAAADQFTYSASLPTLTSISPATGPSTGGTSVTVTGTNFTGTTAVLFGTTPAASFTVNSATSITAVSPAGSGTVDITVAAPGGNSMTAAADQFVYVAALSGTVFSGALPIASATVELYAAGTTGYGTGSSALTTVPATITTDSGGNFSIQYSCPASGAPGDQMYLIATGGDSGSGANASIVLMAALGTCSQLASPVRVNEVTTVASAYALSAFATINGSGGITVGAPATGSSCNAASGWISQQAETCNYIGLANAFAAVSNLVSLPTGTALTHTPAYQQDLAGDPNILNNSTVPTTRINALADMLASCVESSSSNCGSGLFTAAATTVSAPGAPAPVTPIDTLQAALNIAQNPGNNVSNLLGLVIPMATPPYSLTSPDAGSSPLVLSGTGVPTDLTLALTFTGGGLGMAPSLQFSLSDGSFGVVNGALAIDATGNIWVGGGIYTSNFFNTNASMVAEFNALGAPITKATTLNGLTPTYGGFDPELTLDQALRNHGISSLTIDQSGNLWTDDGLSSLLEISSSLSVLNTIAEIGDPAKLAIDSTGNNVWFFLGTTPATVNEVLGNGMGSVAGVNPPAGVYLADYLTFDSGGGMWSSGQNASSGFDVFQLSPADGSVLYDAFASSTAVQNYRTTLATDGSGNVYACDPSGANLDTFNANPPIPSNPVNLMVSASAISTQRACGTQLVLDGKSHLFAVLNEGGNFPGVNSAFTKNIDEFTTGGTLISPQQNGYLGSSSTEAPTLNPDPNWVQLVTGVGAAMDGSGNLWVLNSDTFGNLPGNALVEYIGIGAPVITPAALAQANGLLGVRP
jgi:hypothetical protein